MNRIIRLLTLTFVSVAGLFSTAAQAFGPDLDPVVAELFTDYDAVAAGDEFQIAVRITPESGWHTYWINPGDAGRPTQVAFSGVEGLVVSEPRFPVPEAVREEVLMTYGYGHAHTLLYQARMPEAAHGEVTIQAHVSWLVCKDICIPGSAHLSETMRVGSKGSPRNADVFTAAKSHFPSAASGETGRFDLVDGAFVFDLPARHAKPAAVYPDTQYLMNHAAEPRWSSDGLQLQWPIAFEGVEAPSAMRLLVLSADGSAQWLNMQRGSVQGLSSSAAPASSNKQNLMTVWNAIILAFLGGMLLNLMPCVFPVLALKAMGLSRGEDLAEKRTEAWIYTAGVIASFVGLAAILLMLRAGGAALGWGFQLQNPAVVAVLAVMLAFLGLALAGWTQIGMGFMGWGQNLTQGNSPKAAFFTGVLAVVVASPCTAPFMGAALGFAITQPTFIALAVFFCLGLGLAAPILLIALVPGLARRLPKPGPWMDKAKHIMAIPLFATAAWLLWVVASQAGLPALVVSIAALLVIAVVSRQSPDGRLVESAGLRAFGWLVAIILVSAPALLPPAESRLAGEWQAWSKQRVEELQAQKQAVFVDFTADWCISCLVNERTALSHSSVQTLLADKEVVLLKADWTRQDPAITAGLAEFDRNGVPLYLLYTPAGEVIVLPQILTPGNVREALERL